MSFVDWVNAVTKISFTDVFMFGQMERRSGLMRYFIDDVIGFSLYYIFRVWILGMFAAEVLNSIIFLHCALFLLFY